MQRVVVLGSTGSIGRQTLDVARRISDRVEIVGLAAGRNASGLVEQHKDFPQAKLALFVDGGETGIPSGMDAIVELATGPDVDCVVVSVAGVVGLLPTLRAIEAGKRIALASKEVLVAAGELVMPLAMRLGVQITPIDSEHSAVFQCLEGRGSDQVQKVLLTASGGPFRGRRLDELANIGVEQALNHPTWRMGGKITIDSATLMNKALELIEAKWLFGIDLERIEIVIHPQSIVHSMVQFKDGSILGQMGVPDMRLPIQYALLFPERVDTGLPPWNPLDKSNLSFESFDETVFRGPSLAREAFKMGGTAPCAFNAANEEAANAFLRGEIGFLQIQDSVERVLATHEAELATLPNLLMTDGEARERIRELFAAQP